MRVERRARRARRAPRARGRSRRKGIALLQHRGRKLRRAPRRLQRRRPPRDRPARRVRRRHGQARVHVRGHRTQALVRTGLHAPEHLQRRRIGEGAHVLRGTRLPPLLQEPRHHREAPSAHLRDGAARGRRPEIPAPALGRGAGARPRRVPRRALRPRLGTAEQPRKARLLAGASLPRAVRRLRRREVREGRGRAGVRRAPLLRGGQARQGRAPHARREVRARLRRAQQPRARTRHGEPLVQARVARQGTHRVRTRNLARPLREPRSDFLRPHRERTALVLVLRRAAARGRERRRRLLPHVGRHPRGRLDPPRRDVGRGRRADLHQRTRPRRIGRRHVADEEGARAAGRTADVRPRGFQDVLRGLPREGLPVRRSHRRPAHLLRAAHA